jgi:hypothetical protein
VVYRRGANWLLTPHHSDIGASNQLAPHSITFPQALIAGDTPDAFALIRGSQTVNSRYVRTKICSAPWYPELV